MDECELTGCTQYRRGFFGRLILQVQEKGRTYSFDGGGSYSPEYTRWRDAGLKDLQELYRLGKMPINTL